jgi:hypothetical protein
MPLTAVPKRKMHPAESLPEGNLPRQNTLLQETGLMMNP